MTGFGDQWWLIHTVDWLKKNKKNIFILQMNKYKKKLQMKKWQKWNRMYFADELWSIWTIFFATVNTYTVLCLTKICWKVKVDKNYIHRFNYDRRDRKTIIMNHIEHSYDWMELNDDNRSPFLLRSDNLIRRIVVWIVKHYLSRYAAILLGSVFFSIFFLFPYALFFFCLFVFVCVWSGFKSLAIRLLGIFHFRNFYSHFFVFFKFFPSYAEREKEQEQAELISTSLNLYRHTKYKKKGAGKKMSWLRMRSHAESLDRKWKSLISFLKCPLQKELK